MHQTYWLVVAIMGGLALIAWFIQGIQMFKKYLNKKKQKEMKPLETTNVPQPQLPMTKELVVRVLRNIGCDPRIDEVNDNEIDFLYQGGHFIINASDDCLYVILYFTWWFECPLDDLDTFSAIQKVVNQINGGRATCTTLYSINEEERRVGVHCKKHFIFVPEIRNLETYLRSELHEMFRVRDFACNEIHKILTTEQCVSQS